MKNLFKFKCKFNFLKNNSLKTLFIIVSLLLPLSYSQITLSANFKENDKVSVKCHVSLVDGNDIISFWSVQQNRLGELKDNIVGKKVTTSTSNQRIKIYKAYECALEDNDFKTSKARLLDSKTPR